MFSREEAFCPLAGVGEGLTGSILEGGGEVAWGLSIQFACVPLTHLVLLWYPDLWLCLAFPITKIPRLT